MVLPTEEPEGITEGDKAPEGFLDLTLVSLGIEMRGLLGTNEFMESFLKLVAQCRRRYEANPVPPSFNSGRCYLNNFQSASRRLNNERPTSRRRRRRNIVPSTSRQNNQPSTSRQKNEPSTSENINPDDTLPSGLNS